MTERSVTTDTVQPISELFNASTSALWATTYNIDLTLFNEFLFSRLGDSPHNVVVLADDRRLAASLQRVPPEKTDTLSVVNRRWLLRGVRVGQHAFHPKSYLAVSRNQATLLVGSGNLSSAGLDDGREVFTTFRSGDPVGDDAIAGWRAWMRQLVEMVNDATLAERFQDLDDRLPALPAVPAAGALLHNLETPIADQFISRVMAESDGLVSELLLTAPFYDNHANAVARLLTNLKPVRVKVFVTGTTSVDGSHLTKQLVASGVQVEISLYEPDQFVHAKLVGVISGQHGWLLSGSANLSMAALTRAAHNGGNVELAVLSSIDPNQVSEAFLPPDMTTVSGSLETLGSLQPAPDEEVSSFAVQLITASTTAEGYVELRSDPCAQADWLLDDLTEPKPLRIESSGRVITTVPISGRLVQLVGTDDTILSNRVVVDDPTSLRAVLTAKDAQSASDNPIEFSGRDFEYPLAQALLWMHRHFVMDVTEMLAASPTGGVSPGESNEQAEDDLWERLEREQLAGDPRANTYARMWTRDSLYGTDPIIELLEILRDRTPAEITPPRVDLSLLSQLLEQQPSQPIRRWKTSTRIRVRARNVLSRWADAQTDPRLVWVDPLAPAGNFVAISKFFAYLRINLAQDAEHVEFTEEDLDDLWLRWLRTLVGTGQGDGWLDQLDDADLLIARTHVLESMLEETTALCWLAVQTGIANRQRIIAWRPVLNAALTHGLIDPTKTVARYLTEVTGHTLTSDHIGDRLQHVIGFIDDELWCDGAIEDLALETLELRASPGSRHFQVRVDVRGVSDPLMDPRVPRLIVAVRQYRGCDGVALYDADNGWRVVAANGRPIGYMSSATSKEPDNSLDRIDEGVLEHLAGTGGVLGNLFSTPESA